MIHNVSHFLIFFNFTDICTLSYSVLQLLHIKFLQDEVLSYLQKCAMLHL